MKKWLALVSIFGWGVAQSALIDRGEGFIYDDVLDITWAQNANINGGGSWNDHMVWVAGYNQTHSIYGTFDDWRLPTTLQPDPSCSDQGLSGFPTVGYGYDCTGSEMGHLFNVDGIGAGLPGLFTNLQMGGSDVYVSDTLFPDNVGAWAFSFDIGYQYVVNKQDPGGPLFGSPYFIYALAVRDGDIAASVVPVPAAFWLFGSGLGFLGWLKRRGNLSPS